MSGGVMRWMDSLMERYVAVCAFLALFILTWVGVGDVRIVSMLGLVLCLVGLAQRSAQADLWVLFPLTVFGLVGMASCYAVYRDILTGYGYTHMLYPVLYLLMACLSRSDLRLLRRLCVLWTGAAALAGLVQFAVRAVAWGGGTRLGGILGNPNAMGIFLVAGWFVLMGCGPEEGEDAPRWVSLLPCLEPLLLMALALTLSMGSFAAMAGGILWLAAWKKRRASWRDTAEYVCRMLARAALAVGTGILLYLAATRTGAPWLCLPVLLYGLAVTVCWKEFGRFLEQRPAAAGAVSGAGLLVAAAAVFIRSGAVETFAERLEMMGSGLRYLAVNPLLGVGPYQWRLLDMHDGGTYFNTWHIHNALLHVGVELGWIAAAALAAVVVRRCRKPAHPAVRAGFIAFCLHNLIDTSFFYMGDFSLVLLAAGDPHSGGKKLGAGALKGLFGLFAALFAWGLFRSILTAQGGGQ